MGCDIHSIAQRRIDGVWQTMPGNFPFDWRDYGMFGFLAGMRNYSAVTPIAEARGLPEDYKFDVGDDLGEHSFSWLTIAELDAVDYDAAIEDRRFTRQEGPNFYNGAATCEPGQGKAMPLRDFLGQVFMDELERLKAEGVERIVFGFDS